MRRLKNEEKERRELIGGAILATALVAAVATLINELIQVFI